ncbi:MAG: SWIM zinc finger family protein [Sphingomonadaceae bacterium]|nr:SWIM zinc finger family protein [Sphingomonadaceae bacterium]
MKERTGFDLDRDALRKRVGEKTFARGEAYHKGGQVLILSAEPGRVLAQVAGSDDYRTELIGVGAAIGGACSCPAFGDSGFCKHMVAVALAANAAGKNAGGTGTIPRIRKHLQERGIEALVDMIVGFAERDPALFRRLDLASMNESGDTKAVEAGLRKAIDSATRTRDYVEYREAPAWAAGVNEALDALAELLPAGRATLGLQLSERALDRIEEALGSIDDSDGYCGGLLERARDIHLEASSATRPEPVAFARALFRREMESGHDAFDGASGLYADVLGESGLAEYRRLASEAWEKLPAYQAGRGSYDEFSHERYRLEDILDSFAERDGDLEARIALRARDLSSPAAYLKLAAFCLEQGRGEEALRRAEEGLWIFEDGRPDERLLLFTADLLAKAGRAGDAETHVWRGFEKAPSPAFYARLCSLGGEAARERAIAFLEFRLVGVQASRHHFPADLLVDILIGERRADAAWTVVKRYGASARVKEELARMSEAAFPREAREVFAERVEQLILFGGNAGYAEAVALIGRMGRLTGAAEQAAYVDGIRTRHGRKRNLMKLLG